MFSSAENLITETATWLWGPPMLVVLSVVGILFTFLLKGLQFITIGKSAKLTYTQRAGSGEGNITPLQSLYGALGALIGNGNLAGAATAVFMGGPGALLWMWAGAFVGMIIVYAETLLALMNREKSPDGTFSGGPMYYIQKNLKMKWLAVLFALAMGVKTLMATATIQSNSIALAATSIIDPSLFPDWMPAQLPYCVILAVLTWLVVIGGLRSIANSLAKITPLMVILFVISGTVIIFTHTDSLLNVFALIFRSAFTPSSAAGGFAGAGVMMAVRYGVARGFYSNEAGTGSSPIMYSTAKTDNIYYQSLISMFGVFIDTVVSTFTIVVILVTGVWTSGLTSTALTTSAFQSIYGNLGGYIVFIASFLFGYSTLIAWCFYGEQCFVYLWGPRMRKIFRWAFSIAVIFGYFDATVLWEWGDLLNAFTILVNLFALIFLINRVVKETGIFKMKETNTGH
ncbi:alanine/glycine:cation symporter family protein [candidate division KSB1 bacterium]